jgi:hypothetical protein
VEQNQSGSINTWAIFWYAAVFQREGLCLHPANSMVNNIGNDNSGVHCSTTANYLTRLASKPIIHFDSNYAENSLAIKRLKNFFLSIRPSIVARVLAFSKSLLHSL